MAVHRNPDLPVLTPAEFRRRVRPYLPGTVLELRRLWPGARRRGYERGQRFIVGPYCSGCGADLIWLFRGDAKTIASTADRRWLQKSFEIVVQSSTRALYTFPKPWPPHRLRIAGAA